MIQNRHVREAQVDIQCVGRMIIECLEPSTFLRMGDSLTSDWVSDVAEFVECTKTQSATQLLKVRILTWRIGVN